MPAKIPSRATISPVHPMGHSSRPSVPPLQLAAAHTTHAAAEALPNVEYKPVGHGVQLGLALEAEKEPVGQRMQLVEPEGLYAPAAQAPEQSALVAVGDAP